MFVRHVKNIKYNCTLRGWIRANVEACREKHAEISYIWLYNDSIKQAEFGKTSKGSETDGVKGDETKNTNKMDNV